MSPMEWLRSRPRRKANGGVVNATWHPSGEYGCTLTVDNSDSPFTTATPDPDEAQPTGFVEFDGVMSEEQLQQVRDSFQVFARPSTPDTRTSNLVTCGCWPRYSEHRCGQRVGIGA